MPARVFISYRTSDGVDKATALARDLDELFGDEQVFLDKDDLAAGSRWRDEIARTLHDKPILLVLVTPNYLGAVDASGVRRIDHPDDPARTELAAALAADAHVVPLMCDGVENTPDKARLPPPFDQLTELTWRRLRAYDWREDLARLAADLERLGVARHGTAAAAPAGASRRAVLLVGGGLAMLLAGGVGWWAWQQREPGLTGRWTARIGARGAAVVANGSTVVFDLTQEGRRLRLASEPVNVENDPDWQNYRDFWQQRTGKPLARVRWRGEGELVADPGEPRRISVAVRAEVAATGEQVDGGNLSGEVGEAGRRIAGRLWINGEQGERVVVMRRATGR